MLVSRAGVDMWKPDLRDLLWFGSSGRSVWPVRIAGVVVVVAMWRWLNASWGEILSMGLGVAMVYAGAFLVGRHELTELMTGGGRLTKRVVLGGLIGR
ncbi:MAG: hypothetical protein ACRENM_03785 [Candidatus Dormibacteraceae bacterium]